MFGFLDYKDIWVMGKDGGVLGEGGGLRVLGDEGHSGKIGLAGAMLDTKIMQASVALTN